MFANRERERGWCRLIKVNIPSADRQVERERERVCVFLLNFVSFCCCFLLLELVYVFQSLCRPLQKKSDRTRCLAVSILEYNIYWNSRSAELGFLKEERNSVVIHL